MRRGFTDFGTELDRGAVTDDAVAELDDPGATAASLCENPTCTG